MYVCICKSLGIVDEQSSYFISDHVYIVLKKVFKIILCMHVFVNIFPIQVFVSFVSDRMAPPLCTWLLREAN